ALPSEPDASVLRRAWDKVAVACNLSDEGFTRRAAAHFRLGVADVAQRDAQAVRLIPETVARKFGVVAVALTDKNVVVATSDPSNVTAAREIVEHAGRQPVFLMASPSAIADAVSRAYAPRQAPRNTLEQLVAEVAKSDFQVVTSSGRGLFTSFELEDPAVVQLADLLLQQAVRYRATEIHVEPGRDRGRVRYRIDGVLQPVVGLPPQAHERLVGRLKHLAREEGRTGEHADGFPVRVGAVERLAQILTTPTPDGEALSIRLVAPNEVPTLESLGFDGPEGQAIRSLLQPQGGLLLVAGPARSGTSSFVYACMARLADRNVVSLEGTVERVVPGITQIRYDAAAGRTFAETLQGLLDRDPDVLHA
ncbi:MAG: Flp pilus assembly complex ATPase component TadA, partial [Myxococcales bacterium]|nr:Flp pilus assembly complex ATPase component TadA [Myxococcales bacterium]